MTQYTGLYVQRLSNGTIFGVQVKDAKPHDVSEAKKGESSEQPPERDK